MSSSEYVHMADLLQSEGRAQEARHNPTARAAQITMWRDER